MLLSLPWRVEWDEYGGYDCMWSAHKIVDSDNTTILTIDVSIKSSSKDGADSESLEDKELAEYIVRLVNKDNNV